MWDIIIVGGGPAGAMVAKKCAEQNLTALLLEKRRFPREKGCTGMIMSPMAQEIVKKEYGEIPKEILTTPNYLSGIWFHILGGEDHRQRVIMPLTWRKDLDYWLIGKARQVGAHIWQKAEVIDLIETPQEYIVHKEEFLLIELGARIKELKNLFNQALETLAKDFGFEPRRRPLWRDACVEPLLYGELFSGSFLPARGNSLLVGDAAGLMLPVSGEEIGMALKSGQMAAISVTEARQSNNQVSNLYLSKLKELLLKLQALYHFTIKAGITPFVTSVIKKQKVYKNPC